jgi:hypothetical protein
MDGGFTMDARRNAEILQERLRSRLADLNVERASIEAQLADIQKFLDTLTAYAQLDPSVDIAPAGRHLPVRNEGKLRNPPKEEVLSIVSGVLERAARPMQLRELFEEVGAAGVRLEGTNPPAILGTMIWRARDRFVNLRGHGYWFADRPYKAASYHPDISAGS